MLICLVVFTDQDGGAENGGPEAADFATADCVSSCADDLVGDSIDFLFFRRTTNRIEFTFSVVASISAASSSAYSPATFFGFPKE